VADEFQYAVIRVVPDVERDERINVGVVLFCRRRKFLAARTHMREERLAALAPRLTCDDVRPHLAVIEALAAGDEARGGPLARESQSERFGWITAPSSTVLQPGPVHTGMTGDPAQTLERLFERLVG
jgi:hypothetical protein